MRVSFRTQKIFLRHSVDKHLATICPFYKVTLQLLSKLLQCSTHLMDRLTSDGLWWACGISSVNIRGLYWPTLSCKSSFCKRQTSFHHLVTLDDEMMFIFCRTTTCTSKWVTLVTGRWRLKSRKPTARRWASGGALIEYYIEVVYSITVLLLCKMDKL